jgi:hypothetical protein
VVGEVEAVPQAGAAPAAPAGVAPAGRKTVTAAQVRAYASQFKVTYEQAKKKAEADGYTVTP